MKILHTSDWHIGRTLHGASLEAAHRDFVMQLCALIDAHDVGAVLISGDLFDRSVPSVASLALGRWALEQVCARARAIVTVGNHDSAQRLGLTAPFLADRLVVAALADDIPQAVDLTEDGDVVARVYPLPYLDPDMTRAVLVDAEGDQAAPDDPDATHQVARSHRAVLEAAARRCGRHLDAHPLPPTARVLLMPHAFLSGGLATDSERPIEVGGVEDAPVDPLARLGAPSGPARVHYVAAGHLHRPQDIRSDITRARYSGSPLAFSFSEAGHQKSVTLLDTAAPDLDPQVLPLTPWRDLRRIRASLEAIEDGHHADAADAWCEVTITDDARPHNLVARVRAVLPHTLAIWHTPTVLPRATVTRVTRQVSLADVTQQFATEVGNRDLTAAERALICDLCEEVTR